MWFIYLLTFQLTCVKLSLGNTLTDCDLVLMYLSSLCIQAAMEILNEILTHYFASLIPLKSVHLTNFKLEVHML